MSRPKVIKRLFFLSFMMGAVGVPYLLTSSASWLNDFKSRFTSDKSSAASAEGSQAAAGGQQASFATASFQPAARATRHASPPQDLAEVLQFEGSPAWVIQRWPRVSAGLAQPDLQGYRVPLVTGKGESDVAGSLTYYFDKDQRMKFITFRGTTGDPRKLIALVTQRFSLQPQNSGDPGLALYQLRWNGKPLSELRIRTAPVLRADQPNARYEVELALMRP